MADDDKPDGSLPFPLPPPEDRIDPMTQPMPESRCQLKPEEGEIMRAARELGLLDTGHVRRSYPSTMGATTLGGRRVTAGDRVPNGALRDGLSQARMRQRDAIPEPLISMWAIEWSGRVTLNTGPPSRHAGDARIQMDVQIQTRTQGKRVLAFPGMHPSLGILPEWIPDAAHATPEEAAEYIEIVGRRQELDPDWSTELDGVLGRVSDRPMADEEDED